MTNTVPINSSDGLKVFCIIAGVVVVAAIVGAWIYYAGREDGIKEAKKDKPEGDQKPVIDVPKKNFAEVSTAPVPFVEAQTLKEAPKALAVSAPAKVKPVRATKTVTPVAPKFEAPVFTHSEDFRVVHARGKKYELTGTQARVIERLWAAVKAGCPEVHQSKLLEDLGVYSKRIRDVFKADMEAYAVLIGRAKRKGMFYLNIA